MTEQLTFKRYFTAGLNEQDPLDAIKWRTTTAEILDSKGKPVFRQEGVEAPADWSDTAVNIVASKYFHGQMGTPAREYSVRQLITRVVNAITRFGEENGYFDTENARVFSEELAYLLVHQKFSFNSPVWFNIGAPDVKQQSSACFILGLEDDTVSIYDRLTTEAMLFKRGSGSGINFSKLREEDAPLSSGGSASGPLSFMKAFDASAGVIKSGGTTRRAAKMVILDADHPDIVDFIDCKVKEERKAQALIGSGYDGSFTGEAYRSVFFQNSNNSVRVSDEFMRAVEDDAPWSLISRVDGKPTSTVSARELFRRIAQAAWECGDPGIQFDTTINDWHTCSNTDRIYASNPCFTGDTLVHTDKGLVTFENLLARMKDEEHIRVYTSDLTSESSPKDTIALTSPEAIMTTGLNEVIQLRFANGMSVKCTPNHRFFTKNRGFVRADELAENDEVETLTTSAPAVSSSWDIPVSTVDTDYQRKPQGSTRPVELPTKWTEGFAHYLGWLVGDGCIVDSGRGVVTVYGSPEDQEAIMPSHLKMVTDMQDGFEPKIATQGNGTKQIRLTRRAFARFFGALGVSGGKAATKEVPWSIKEAPPEVVAAFLRGLFDADGCSCDAGDKGRYVGLGSRSLNLLEDVQRLLTTFGIVSRIYESVAKGDSFTYTRKNGDSVKYGKECPTYDLRITSGSLVKFAHAIGFALPAKQARLERFLQHEHYKTRTTTRLASREAMGAELTYNLTEPRNHSYIVNGLIVSNCSEFMFLNETSCNLTSLNLMRFASRDDGFNTESFRAAVEVIITAMEILVGYADYPTDGIDRTTKKFRPLGIGYANLGALLMSLGLPYDSAEGRDLAACITSIMNGVAYAQSARVAAVVGPFEGYEVNRDPMLRVIEKHRAAALRLATGDMDTAPSWRKEAVACWNDALRLGKKYGYRNSQVGVLAPTGTISFMMDCDTTGIEPDTALVKYKKMVGEGLIKIVNQGVPAALRNLGYSENQVQAIIHDLDERGTVEGSKTLRPEHLPVFDCAITPAGGTRSISWRGHVAMMAAVQPFISGAISKTVNMPNEATVEEVTDAYMEAWKSGCKAIAIYRDGCKLSQPVSTSLKQATKGELASASTDAPVVAPVLSHKQPLPKDRRSLTHKFKIGEHGGFVTVGLYDDGRPGEIFIMTSKTGSSLRGMMDAFAISVSLGLQHGVPLSEYIDKFSFMRFDPAGITDDPGLRIAKSIPDYIFRWLANNFYSDDEREALGLHGARNHAFEKLGLSGPLVVRELTGKETKALKDSGFGDDDESEDAIIEAPVVSKTSRGDGVFCEACGSMMVPTGSCYTCPACGAAGGCG